MTPDPAAWRAYETANRRAADSSYGGHRTHCPGCGNPHRTRRNLYCDRACDLATVRKDAA